MAVVESTIEASLNLMLTQLLTKDPDLIPSEFAKELAIIIGTAIKSGTVTVALGIPVATTGTAAAQTGTTTAAGTGTIS